MGADDRADAERESAQNATALAFRTEISDAISSITDRDPFLQRIARRIADYFGMRDVAIYTRAPGEQDLFLRSTTIPIRQGVSHRVSPLTEIVSGEVRDARTAGQQSTRRTLSAPIIRGVDVVGALTVWAEPGVSFTERDADMLRDIAEAISPAVVVAEHHHTVKQSSVVDLATGVYAQWYFVQRFEEEIARAQRTDGSVTVVLAGVQHFSDAQRALGYEGADALLRDLAAEYADLTRLFDVVAARDGAGFSILLPSSGISGAAPVIERMSQRSSSVIERFAIAGGMSRVRVITSAASFPEDGERVPEVMLVAAQRLDQSERLHRDLVEHA